MTTDPRSLCLPRIELGRDLLPEITANDDLVRFRGEWSPDEPEGWETFTVRLWGEEAGDYADATLEDLRSIVAALMSRETPNG